MTTTTTRPTPTRDHAAGMQKIGTAAKTASESGDRFARAYVQAIQAPRVRPILREVQEFLAEEAEVRW